MTDNRKKQHRETPKVLLVGPSVAGGGAEKRFRNLCRALTLLRMDICVLVDSELEKGHDIEQGIICLGWKSEFSYPRMILNLRRILLRGEYDAVLGFGLFPAAVSWLSISLLPQKPRFIVAEITLPWTASKLNRWTRRWLYRSLYRAVYRAADLLVVNSLAGMEECRERFRMRNTKIRVVPNLIDQKEIIHRAEIAYDGQLMSGKKLIVAVSRLIRMKRLDTLIEAAALLAGDESWEVIVMGDGPDRARLEALSESLNMAERINFVGWMENPFPVIKAASAFVLCSEYEGFSNSLLEAMFLGVPVVTSFCGREVRLMCEEGAALGFEVGDSAALAHHLRTVLHSREQSAKMRQAAFLFCASHEMRNGVHAYKQAILEVAGSDTASEAKGGN